MQNKIDIISPRAYIGGLPLEQFKWLRDNAPYYKHALPDNKSCWVITRYSDILKISRDYDNFSSAYGVILPNHGCPLHAASDEKESAVQESIESQQVPSEGSDRDPYHPVHAVKKMMILMDPPEHTDYRKLVNRDLLPKGILGWEETITAIAKDVIDQVIEKGCCDLVADISGELASRVTSKLLGLPDDHGKDLYGFTELFHAMPDTIPNEEYHQRFTELFTYLQEFCRDKRQADVGDLSCRFLFGEVNGEGLNDDDFFQQFLLILNGGTDTVRNVLATGLYQLLKHPDQLAWLMEDLDARIPSARDELLRVTSPIIYQCRTATTDIEIEGNHIQKEDMVLLYYGAGNHDPSKFEEPLQLNLARKNNKHIAFGSGHHICVGQWLARVEIDVMLKEILSRLKNIQLAEEPTWLESNFLFGLKTMNISFDS